MYQQICTIGNHNIASSAPSWKLEVTSNCASFRCRTASKVQLWKVHQPSNSQWYTHVQRSHSVQSILLISFSSLKAIMSESEKKPRLPNVIPKEYNTKLAEFVRHTHLENPHITSTELAKLLLDNGLISRPVSVAWISRLRQKLGIKKQYKWTID